MLSGRELERLIAAARAGDELAFRRLLRAYHGLIERQVQRFYLPGGDRDDVRQEARIGFAKAVRGYRPERGGFGWFARCCVERRLASALTAASAKKHAPLNDAAGGEHALRACEHLADRDTPASRTLAGELVDELRRAAATLTPLERQVLAHTLVGWTTGETARRLGSSAKAPTTRCSARGANSAPGRSAKPPDSASCQTRPGDRRPRRARARDSPAALPGRPDADGAKTAGELHGRVLRRPALRAPDRAATERAAHASGSDLAGATSQEWRHGLTISHRAAGLLRLR